MSGSSARGLRNRPKPNYCEAQYNLIIDEESSDVDDDREESERSQLDRASNRGQTWVVGVDFGTTFSSVCVLSDEMNKPKTIVNWKDAPHPTDWVALQVPSEIEYVAFMDAAGRKRKRNSPDPEQAGPESSTRSTTSATHFMDPATQQPGGEHSSETADDLFVTANGRRAFGFTCRSKNSLEWKAKRNIPGVHRYGASIRISLSKLMLEERKETAVIRKNLEARVQMLKAAGLVEHYYDCIVDFMRYLLQHTKKQMLTINNNTMAFANLKEPDIVQLNLSCPNAWSTDAVSCLQACLALAAKLEKFGDQEGVTLCSEAESAIRSILETRRCDFKDQQKVCVLDIGGGTVDISCFVLKLDNLVDGQKFCLQEEPIQPTGDVCGSTRINRKLEEYLRKAFEHEHYLNEGDNSSTAEAIKSCLADFENGWKREWQLSAQPNEENDITFSVPGLRARNEDTRFQRNIFQIPYEHVRDQIFMPILRRLKDLLARTLKLAASVGCAMEVIVLTGGGAKCPAVIQYLTEMMREQSEDYPPVSLFRYPEGQAPSVDYCAMGNTLFLRHKATGLPKHAYCSLGFVRDDPVLKRTTETDEEWDQKYKRSWGEETETPGVNDGEVYIKGAIDWFCKVGDGPFRPGHKFPLIESLHQFSCEEFKHHKLLCEMTLWRSDTSKESGYKVGGMKNRDCRKVGMIEVDLNKFRHKRFGFKKERVPPADGPGEPQSKEYYWEILLELECTIDNGRNLSWEAFVANEKLESGRLNIAPIFPQGD